MKPTENIYLSWSRDNSLCEYVCRPDHVLCGSDEKHSTFSNLDKISFMVFITSEIFLCVQQAVYTRKRILFLLTLICHFGWGTFYIRDDDQTLDIPDRVRCSDLKRMTSSDQGFPDDVRRSPRSRLLDGRIGGKGISFPLSPEGHTMNS